jgi:methyl-accepting chemotaxis protein WspA
MYCFSDKYGHGVDSYKENFFSFRLVGEGGRSRMQAKTIRETFFRPWIKNMMIEKTSHWFSRFTIRQKLYAGFGFMFFLILTGALVTILVLHKIRTEMSVVVHDNAPMLMHSLALKSDLNQTEAALGFFLLSHEQKHLYDYQKSFESMRTALSKLKAFEKLNSDTQVKNWLRKLEENLLDFETYNQEIQGITQDHNRNYPALAYASEHLNPLTLDLLQALSNMISEEDHDEARAELLRTLHQLRYTWSNIVNVVRAYLGYRSEELIQNFTVYADSFGTGLHQLEQKFGSALNIIQEEELQRAKRLHIEFIPHFRAMTDLHSGSQRRMDVYLLSTKVEPLLQEVHETVNALVAHEKTLMDRGEKKVMNMTATVILFALIILSLSILLGGLPTVWLVNSIVRPLRHMAEVSQQVAAGDLSMQLEKRAGEDEISQVLQAQGEMIQRLATLIMQIQDSGIQLSRSSAHIATTARQQEATVTQQAATVKEIMATTHMISESTTSLSHTIQHVTHMAEETSHAAASGHQELHGMESSMRNMLKATDTINYKLEVVKEKTGNIGSVVTTINKIADQTNLLSLNAAIEAEKAGEYGLGFSVVAKEIRRLADQTAMATWDIEQIVREMQTAVAGSVEGMERFSAQIRLDVENSYLISEKLAGIIARMQSLLPSFANVREEMQSQSLSAGEINEAISELGEATRHTAESISSSNQAIQELNNIAQTLYDSVSIFQVRRKNSA